MKILSLRPWPQGHTQESYIYSYIYHHAKYMYKIY